MALNLYLDDCSNSDLLAVLLRQAGHTVKRPNDTDVNLVGEDDDVHLAFAARNGLAIITKNPADFLDLHKANQQHGGILVVYQDNDPTRDMSDAEIVNAIKNLEEAIDLGGDPIPGMYHVLNNWRYLRQIGQTPCQRFLLEVTPFPSSALHSSARSLAGIRNPSPGWSRKRSLTAHIKRD